MRAVQSFLVFLSIFLFCVATLPAQTDKPADAKQISASGESDEDRYLIGYEDVLEINVVKHAELRQKVSVGRNGKIFMPRIDEPITVLCKTNQQVADEITKAYKKDFLRDPFVSVEVIEQKSHAAAIIGAVDKPGNYYLTRKTHLLQLLSLAGGPNIHAGMRLLVARSGTSTTCKQESSTVAEGDVEYMEYNVKEIQEGKKVVWVQPGDVVSVLEADNIYVYGNVRREGSVPMKEPITLMQAIVSAQGIKSAAQKDKVRVLRKVDGSPDRQELMFDLGAIASGKARDPFLEPSDIVAVSEDKTKMILTKIANSATGGIPALFYRVPLP
jgi:polysaccharide biosynthesis/export protein